MEEINAVTGAVGLKGELPYPYTDYKEKFEEIDYVLMDTSQSNVRYRRKWPQLSGIDDRTAAEACKGKDLFLSERMRLLFGRHLLCEGSQGLSVVEKTAKCIGRLKRILNEAQDIYMIEPEDGGKPFPVPAVNEFIKEVDLQKGTITVRLIEGLREL